jgi:hypothetical protein
MSTKDKIYSLIDDCTEEQLLQLLSLLESQKEAEDDAFCQQLLQEYFDENDQNTTDFVSLEDVASELGIKHGG